MALAAVLLSFLLTPSARVTLAPLEKAASELKQTITNYLFFTEPRDVFTLGSYGYYPMGNNQLGGEAQPTDFPVMMVKTDQKLLLRAVSRDYYDGRSFTDTSSGKRYLYINPRWQAQRRKAFLELMPSEAIRSVSALLDEKAVSVQMQNDAASTVFTPVFLRSLTMTGDMVAYFNESSELFITRDLKLGDRYTCTPLCSRAATRGWRRWSTPPEGRRVLFGVLRYLHPAARPHGAEGVTATCRTSCRTKARPTAKPWRSCGICRSITATPSPPKRRHEPGLCDVFPLRGKEGYCTYYASAMTVMCRMAGLPARYVEVFWPSPRRTASPT
jgi:hypothetical protein